MSDLLVHPHAPDAQGRILDVTPQSAGWTYVGFAVHKLAAGQSFSLPTGNREFCLVFLSGTAKVGAGDIDFGDIGGRANPFEGNGHAVYVPANSTIRVAATSPLEIALCSAPATGTLPARHITPDQVGHEERGQGTNRRFVRDILMGGKPAESLLVVEVITPAGNWSSYPPHKHDRDAIPEESQLEETYYHRLNPPQGFGFQRVYTDDRSLDETMSFADGDCVLVPRGYHPVGAPHGYDLY
ncbi:MAG: 5-deoxy-glucuronate isomerase, partial [Hyphomicrobiales bacterium]